MNKRDLLKRECGSKYIKIKHGRELTTHEYAYVIWLNDKHLDLPKGWQKVKNQTVNGPLSNPHIPSWNDIKEKTVYQTVNGSIFTIETKTNNKIIIHLTHSANGSGNMKKRWWYRKEYDKVMKYLTTYKVWSSTEIAKFTRNSAYIRAIINNSIYKSTNKKLKIFNI
jgi:hypothetical protein